jgi:hypothetical protein
MWRQDSGGTWKLGRDVGYGLGWKLLAGSITPIYLGSWAIHHYIYTDSTGAEYRLDVNNGGVWTSREGFYGSFDANTWYLYFPDGSKWQMYSQSGGYEEDAGTQYPTAFFDTNGNYILIGYAAGAGMGWTNSSSRITSVLDSRTPGGYFLTYNSDPIPHLVSLVSSFGGESCTFQYLTNQTLKAPFAGELFGTATLLQMVTTTGLNIGTNFQYDQTSGELTQMTTPLGGSLLWHYRTYTYSGSRKYREVDSRQLTVSSGAVPWSWSIALDSNRICMRRRRWRMSGRGRRRCRRSGRRGWRRRMKSGTRRMRR